MNTSNFEWPVDKKPLYSLLSIRLRGLIDGIPHQISNLANASALLGDALQSVIFCGQFNTCLSVSLPAPNFRFCPSNLSG